MPIHAFTLTIDTDLVAGNAEDALFDALDEYPGSVDIKLGEPAPSPQEKQEREPVGPMTGVTPEALAAMGRSSLAHGPIDPASSSPEETPGALGLSREELDEVARATRGWANGHPGPIFRERKEELCRLADLIQHAAPAPVSPQEGSEGETLASLRAAIQEKVNQHVSLGLYEGEDPGPCTLDAAWVIAALDRLAASPPPVTSGGKSLRAQLREVLRAWPGYGEAGAPLSAGYASYEIDALSEFIAAEIAPPVTSGERVTLARVKAAGDQSVPPSSWSQIEDPEQINHLRTDPSVEVVEAVIGGPPVTSGECGACIHGEQCPHGHAQRLGDLTEPVTSEQEGAREAEARELLDALAGHEDDPCELDHHGYCQAHNWFDESECATARARRWLAAAPSPSSSTEGVEEAPMSRESAKALIADGQRTWNAYGRVVEARRALIEAVEEVIAEMGDPDDAHDGNPVDSAHFPDEHARRLVNGWRMDLIGAVEAATPTTEEASDVDA